MTCGNRFRPCSRHHFFDAAWASGLPALSDDVRILCNEPIPATFALLQEAVVDGRAILFDEVLSSADGTIEINAVPGCRNLASVYALDHLGSELITESVEVACTTGDAAMKRHGVERITIPKVDTEGRDRDVIAGFSHATEVGQIDMIKFEYNHMTLLAGKSLKAFFDVLRQHFLSCRLLPIGLEATGYHHTPDNFGQSNWVAVRQELGDEGIVRRVSIRRTAGLAGAALELDATWRSLLVHLSPTWRRWT